MKIVSGGATIGRGVSGAGSGFRVGVARCGSFLASAGGVFILAVGMGTRLSFLGV